MSYINLENRLSDFFKGKSITFLRYSMGIIFLWYGALKIGGDPAVNELMMRSFWPVVKDPMVINLIGIWEMSIGVCFFFNKLLRYALILFFLHFPGTFLPLFTNTEMCFISVPFSLTIEGHYIFKNIILVSVALFLLSTLHRAKK